MRGWRHTVHRFVLLLGFGFPTFAGVVADSEIEKTFNKTELSPSGNIRVEHRCNYAPRTATLNIEIWLAERQSPTNTFLLFSSPHPSEVKFSPNEKWLVVNENAHSSPSAPILFRKLSGIKYAEVKEAQISKRVWEKAEKVFGNSTKKRERYQSEVHCWSKDSSAFVVDVWDNRSGSMPWACVFDLDTFSVSRDATLLDKPHRYLYRLRDVVCYALFVSTLVVPFYFVAKRNSILWAMASFWFSITLAAFLQELDPMMGFQDNPTPCAINLFFGWIIGLLYAGICWLLVQGYNWSKKCFTRMTTN